jgi:DNA-binding transcriptional ArsR family regulator
VTRIDELDRAFAALADPTRREVIRCLLEKPRRAGELGARARPAAPAMSKHLRVLRHARLVSESGIADDARVRVYRVDAEASGRSATGSRRSRIGVASFARSRRTPSGAASDERGSRAGVGPRRRAGGSPRDGETVASLRLTARGDRPPAP